MSLAPPPGRPEAAAAALAGMGLTLAVAESLTGGLVAARIVSVPGASRYFVAGYVAYSNAAKVRDLDVGADLLSSPGAVSPEVARAMAAGAASRAGAAIGLSTTGEAGPEPAGAPVGLVFVGLATPGGLEDYEFSFEGEREEVRSAAAAAALTVLRSWIEGSR